MPGNLIVDKPSVCQRGLPGRLSSHCSSNQHGRSTAHTSTLVALPASLGSSYRPALRWPGILGLRSASRCPRPFTPSGLRRQRPVSRTARGLRAPRLRRPSVPALRTALAFGGAVFRRCGRLLGVSSRLQPLRGLCLRTACARASSRFAASNGQRPGRECIFTHSSQSSIHIARKACLWLLLLTGLTSACFAHSARPSCAPQKMPEMTYTPSFLIRTFFFRDFVNGLFARPPLDAGQCVFGWISPQKRVIVHSSFKRALNSVIVSSAIVKHTQEGKIIGSEQT